MITKNVHKKAYESFNCSNLSIQKNVIPPWCSSRKVTVKRKLSPNWEIQSSYPLRENIWEYLYDGENLKWRSKRQNRKSNKHGKRYGRKTKLIIFILLFIAGLIGYLWTLFPIQSSKLLPKIIAKAKLLSPDWENSSASEECCHKMRHLALELSRAERILRNAFRLRTTVMSTSRIKSEKPTVVSRYIVGASASKGSGTEEWAGRVTLWGVVPLWRAAPPPDTVLALRDPTPADCWPFSGSSGELLIQLPRIQRVQSISVEHVRPDTARSAPKRFVVYGLLANDTELEIVNNEYRRYGPAKQYFSICTNAAMKGVIINVLTNHGNMKYTCIYRVHLYGTDEVHRFGQYN